MNVCTCFLLFGTFAYIISSPVTTPTEDERSANLALKTSQEFNVTKKETDETVIGHKSILPSHSVETFTDFIQEIVTILNTYDDDILEDFIKILDKKIRKYHYKGCKFYELKGKREFRSLLAENLDLLTRKSVTEKRAFINKSINIMKRLNKYDRNTQELLDYINILYKDDAKEKFRKILTDLMGYSAGYGKTKTRDDFVRVIKECIRTVVFIHTDFKTNDRQELKTLLAKIKEFSSSTNSTTNFIDFKPSFHKSNTYTVEFSENVSNENKTLTPSSKTNPTRTTAHIKEDHRRIRIFKPDTSEAKQEDAEDATITSETSEIDESNNQNKTILMFYMTTEEPGITYKSERKSKLVEIMLEEESTGRLATGQSTTTQGLRMSSKKDLNSRMSDEGNSTEITEKSSKKDLNNRISDEGSSTEITEMPSKKDLKKGRNKMSDEGSSSEITEMSSKMDHNNRISDEGSSTEITEIPSKKDLKKGRNKMSDEGSSTEITEMSSKMDHNNRISDEGSSTEITEMPSKKELKKGRNKTSDERSSTEITEKSSKKDLNNRMSDEESSTEITEMSSRKDLNNKISDEGSSSEITEISSRKDLNNKMSDEGSSSEITEISSRKDLNNKISDEGSSSEITEKSSRKDLNNRISDEESSTEITESSIFTED